MPAKPAPQPADETVVIPEPLKPEAPVIPGPEAPVVPVPETVSPVTPDMRLLDPPSEFAPPTPGQRYFRSVGGITDGANHYGVGDWFVGSEALLAHLARTRGYDNKRLLYREISEQEYLELETARIAAIQTDIEVEPTYTPQVQENMVTSSVDGGMA